MRRRLDFGCALASGTLVWVVAMAAASFALDLPIPSWLGGVAGAFAGLVVGVLGYAGHVAIDRRLSAHRDQVEGLEEMAARGLLRSTRYRARRACQIDEWEDEGPHYLLELEDHSLLYLSGQFLCEYEPIEVDEDPELLQPRLFPCTEFTVHQHRDRGYVVALSCDGDVIEPAPLLDAERQAPIRQALGAGELDEVRVVPGPSFDELVGPGKAK